MQQILSDTDMRTFEVTIEEAASICGVTAVWIRKLARDGHIQKTRRGSVRLSDCVRAIERSILRLRPPAPDQGYDARW